MNTKENENMNALPHDGILNVQPNSLDDPDVWTRAFQINRDKQAQLQKNPKNTPEEMAIRVRRGHALRLSQQGSQLEDITAYLKITLRFKNVTHESTLEDLQVAIMDNANESIQRHIHELACIKKNAEVQAERDRKNRK